MSEIHFDRIIWGIQAQEDSKWEDTLSNYQKMIRFNEFDLGCNGAIQWAECTLRLDGGIKSEKVVIFMNQRKFWNKLANNYDKNAQGKYGETYRRTVNLAREYLEEDDVVLDFGCGTGIVTNELAGSVKQIIATDVSDQMIVQAKSKAVATQIDNIEYRVGDLNQDQIKTTKFSSVTAFNVLYFIHDLDGLLKQFNAMLPEGGYFLSVTDCLGGRQNFRNVIYSFLMRLGFFPYMRYLSQAELTKAIEKAGFEVVKTENLFPNPPNVFVAARKK